MATEGEDELEFENAREGAFASPTTPLEEAASEGKKVGKGKRRARGASASAKAVAADSGAAVVPEPTPVEHFGMGAGGGVDLSIDYLTGEIRNEAALKQAMAEGGGASSSS